MSTDSNGLNREQIAAINIYTQQVRRGHGLRLLVDSTQLTNAHSAAVQRPQRVAAPRRPVGASAHNAAHRHHHRHQAAYTTPTITTPILASRRRAHTCISVVTSCVTGHSSKLLEYFSYLKLLLSALDALPDIQFTVYRGIKVSALDRPCSCSCSQQLLSFAQQMFTPLARLMSRNSIARAARCLAYSPHPWIHAAL